MGRPQAAGRRPPSQAALDSSNPRLVKKAPTGTIVGAVPKAFLARQVPTNERRKAVAKTDSSGWRPAVKNVHTPGSMWHGLANCGLRTANCQSTSPALRATSPMRRGFGAPRYRNRDSLIMPEAGSPRASPYNRSQAINLSRPTALCVGAVPKAFLARQVPTNGRRKAVAKTDSSGWRPVVKNPYTSNGSMWHGFANCERPINLSGLRATSPMR